MARLVPAKPRFDRQAEETLVLYLERALDDSYVIFQKKPIDGYTVMHPDFGGCNIMVYEQPLSFDPDTEAWQEVDLTAQANSARKAVSNSVLLPFGAVAWLAGTGRKEDTDPRMAFEGELENLIGCIRTALAASKPLNEFQINTILQSISPGSMPYERNRITDAQSKWRTLAREDMETSSAISSQESTEKNKPAEQTSSGLFSSGFGLSLNSTINTVSDKNSFLGTGESSLTGPAATAGVGEIKKTPVLTQAAPSTPDIKADDPILLLLRKAVESALGDRPTFVSGVQISLKDIIAPDFMLPAILLSAAERWAAVVVGKEGEGGFNIRMRSDLKALTGYRVTHITPSTPFLLMLPVVDRIKRCFINPRGSEECHLDAVIEQFNFWLAANKLNTEQIENFSIAVALAV